MHACHCLNLKLRRGEFQNTEGTEAMRTAGRYETVAGSDGSHTGTAGTSFGDGQDAVRVIA